MSSGNIGVYGSDIESKSSLGMSPYEFSVSFRPNGEDFVHTAEMGDIGDIGGITIKHCTGIDTFIIHYKNDGTLTDLHNEPLGNYIIDDWNTVTIKFSKNTIRYLINDNLVKIVTPHSGTPTNYGDYLILSSNRYINIWYDDIKVYSLWGVPGFED